VRLFDRKSCLSVHGEHATLVSRALYRGTAQVTRLGGADGLPSVTLAPALLPALLRELLVERGEHAVEVLEGAGAAWAPARRGSPGNWGAFEAELARGGDDAPDAPLVVALALGAEDGARRVGLAFADAAARRLGACEFADDEHFGALEAALTQLGAREVVISADLLPDAPGDAAAMDAESAGAAPRRAGPSPADRARLAAVVGRCCALCSARPRAAFSVKGLEDDLRRLLKGGAEAVESHRPVLEGPLAAAALAGALAFTELPADASARGRLTLELHATGRHLRLDAAAARALNVFPARGDAAGSFSLFGLLNRARTAMGKRLLKAWLKAPLLDLTELKARHDVVEALAADAPLRGDLAALHLRGLPDVGRLAGRLDRRAATLQDLCQLYRAAARLPLLEAALRAHAGPHAPLLAERFAAPLAAAGGAEALGKFEALVEAAVDLDRIPDEYLVAAGYDAGLREVQEARAGVEAEIAELAAEAAADLGLVLDKTLKLEWFKAGRERARCLRVTAKEERLVRKKLQAKYVELETRKDGTKFTTRALRGAADRLGRLAADYDARQAGLVRQVVAVAASFAEVWERVGAVVAELDVLAGFAELAATAPRPFVRPVMLPADAGEISLTACRHPCVEAQDGVEFIPNDAALKRGESWFTVITGPNMGGKSTYIRQVALAVLMAQVGAFVPAAAARIAARDAIFARVGAGDCQLRGVSTFMAEMLETAAILKGATPASLVIIDELGRGTSTWDGMGLAWAISEHLMAEVGAATLFATHFHELTALAGPAGVANLHVRAAVDEKSGGLTMLYQVLPGACDQSFGIAVAEFARFPPEVVAAARLKAAELESFDAGGAGAGGAAGGSAAEGAGERKRKADGAAATRAALLDFATAELDEATLAATAARLGEQLEALGHGPAAVQRVA
jgi:DNA mismatch repair protein MSH2